MYNCLLRNIPAFCVDLDVSSTNNIDLLTSDSKLCMTEYFSVMQFELINSFLVLKSPSAV